MPARVANILWSLGLCIFALVVGGWVATQLYSLEEETLKSWAQTLESTGNKNAQKTSQWLEAQKSLLTELNEATPQLAAYLKQVQEVGGALPVDVVTRAAFEERVTLKYGLTHAYVFSPQGQLLLSAEKAMALPLKERENLAFAYKTGLGKYMFFTTVRGKSWFVGSKRLREGGQELGYIAYLTEADLVLEELYHSWNTLENGDLNLARRVGEEDVFFTLWRQGRPYLRRFSIEKSQLPLFGGVADIVQSIKFQNGEERLFYIADVPYYPFWQQVSSIPLEVAFSDVRQARIFYLLGYGVFLLVILAFLIGFLRRIFWPQAPSLAGALAEHKSVAPVKEKVQKTVNQVHKKVKDTAVSTANKVANAVENAPVTKFVEKIRAEGGHTLSQRVQSPLARRIIGRIPWKARTLTDEERQNLKSQKKPSVAENSWQNTAEDTFADVIPPTPINAHAEVRTEVAPTPEVEKEAPIASTTPDMHKPAPKLDDVDKEEAARVAQIHRCIQNEKYRLYFQPILETKTREKVMFETLLRLVDDDGELMQPPSFFPLAMKHNFVDQLDDMVIVASLRRHMEILTQGKDTILSINLSYGAFRSMNFMQTYQEGVRSQRLKPHLLNFELMSKEIIEDDAAMKFVREMQKSGAKFSVDFFGDPEKTVQAAKKLKFDFMKVDCLKFPGLGMGDAEQVARFRDVVSAWHKYNLPMVAEKIETRSIMWLCEKLGVAYAQGFYLAEPSPKLNLGW